MSGIQVEQGSTTINAAGAASFSVPQAGLVTGVLVTASLVGTTHASYLWSLAAPAGSGETLDDVSSATPTFTPDLSGDAWLLVLRGLDSSGDVEATYLLPLLIAQTALADFPGPISLAYLHESSVATPNIGQVLFQNWDQGGAISAKDTSAVTRQVAILTSGATADRPATTYLDVGYRFFDTDLGKPIWWTGADWVTADGLSA